ncbi:restriction endonuclease [Chryseobacterium sediminis]|uniref:Restriction endonuclease n=1 Tax=Chryseobacterium sediminis TaxID=1679494 RepID=A0A5B2U8U8_9FLAO|nr:restriction endonuclease [Chryseobacterium sediminis]KAA2223061.1 restriction endonuclease [Chryseobacterium sediminis]
MKAGKEYELLIANMYQSLEPNALVTHDDHIFDDRGKIMRQIDVSIKYKFAGADHLIIVQAKDHKHKADIAIVDQFRQVITDTKANKGILVCSNGFTKAAITKAESYGIECLTVHSAINKKWETLLKIPVRKVINEFGLNMNFTLAIPVNKMEGFNMPADTFSYDKKNVVVICDIINDHIFGKLGWEYIKKQKNIRIDLSKIELYHYANSEMVPVTGGFIEINYIKSSTKQFYITPKNYIYSKDHIKDKGTLHNMTITQDILDNIVTGDNENDKDVKEDPIITLTTFGFNNMETFFSNFSFNVKGEIEGDFFTKENILMKNDERGREVVQIERILKRGK